MSASTVREVNSVFNHFAKYYSVAVAELSTAVHLGLTTADVRAALAGGRQ